MDKNFKILQAVKDHLASLTPEEKKKLKKELCGPDIPDGWVSIEDHLPKWKAKDLMQGYSKYKVKTKDKEFISGVTDHTMWYYEAKQIGITHWLNE